MPDAYTTRAKFQQLASNEAGWGNRQDENWAALDAIETLGGLLVTAKETPSTTLNVAVAAGDYRKADGTVVSYAGTASFATTTARTNYLYLTDSGTLTEATSFPAGNIVRLAVVVSGATTITSVTDKRTPFQSYGANFNTVYLPLAGGTLTGATTVSTGGFTVTAGGLLVTAGGLMVSAGTTAVAALTCTTLAPSSTITVADGQNIVLNTTTGTKIGTATGQKLGFYNATPVAQIAGSTDILAGMVTLGFRAASSNPPLNMGSGALTCGAVSCTTLAPSSSLTMADAQNVVLNTTTGTKVGTAVGQKLGFWDATPVVQQASANQAAAAALTSATLTDSTTGTANTTVVDVTASHDQAILNSNFADLIAQINALRADLVARDTLLTAIRTALVNTGIIKGSA